MAAPRNRKPASPKAGTVTIIVKNSTREILNLEMRVARKRGKPEFVNFHVTGISALRAYSVLNDPSILDPGWKPVLNTDPKTPPKAGDIIYVRTSIFIDHGEDDLAGGLAHVDSVKNGISAGQVTAFVTTREHPGRGYNWEMLALEQERLAREFGTKWAHPDPCP